MRPRHRRFGRTLLILLTFLFCSTASAVEEVRIGVLSHRGDEVTRHMWGPTADYLTSVIPGYHFTVRPLQFDQVDPTVAAGEVEFVFVNPGIYVNLEVKYRVSRIATLYNRRHNVPYKIFGGV
ncbi:MAG: PhnD/SsuA/transferrin family substrate-binding protein, partial [Candidatus Thiodiazotropha sp.]